LKAVKEIKDPDAFQLLGDETRRRIIYLLRAKEMTVSQIAHDMGLTAQAIYHHIRKLKKAGMIEVAKEERIDHFIETYYRSSAEIFHLSHGEGKGRESGAEQLRIAMQELVKLGVGVSADPETVSKVASAMKRLDKACADSEIAEKINDLEEVDFFVKQTMLDLAMNICQDDAQFEEHVKLQRELRKLLLSGRKQAQPATKKPKA